MITIETQLNPEDRLNFSTQVRELNFFRVFSTKIILSPVQEHGEIKSVPSMLSLTGYKFMMFATGNCTERRDENIQSIKLTNLTKSNTILSSNTHS
jgi:hypothetical protein